MNAKVIKAAVNKRKKMDGANRDEHRQHMSQKSLLFSSSEEQLRTSDGFAICALYTKLAASHSLSSDTPNLPALALCVIEM